LNARGMEDFCILSKRMQFEVASSSYKSSM
jgi:hypothetical protein